MTKWIQKDAGGDVIGSEDIADPVARADDDVLSVEIQPGIDIDHSDFPHPLVIVDYAEDGSVVAISLVGPVKKAIEEAIASS